MSNYILLIYFLTGYLNIQLLFEIYLLILFYQEDQLVHQHQFPLLIQLALEILEILETLEIL